jgi:putative DNA primase/helicase
MWREGVEPRGSVVEDYLNSRGLELDEGLTGEVIRYHRGSNAMLALFRDIVSDEPRAISRTFITPEGSKIGRKFLGPVGGCAIKLDPEEEVLGGLHIGEGIETCMSARQGVLIGDAVVPLRPTWALGSAGAIAAFPVLVGTGCLTIIRENDAANERAAAECALRWHAAGREVRNVWPDTGKDLNDELRGAR